MNGRWALALASVGCAAERPHAEAPSRVTDATDDDPPVVSTPSTAEETGPTEPESPLCEGMPGAPGTADREIVVGGVRRHYRVHVPEDLDPDEPAPIVLVFHGYLGSGAQMDDLTTWSAIADREGFVVVYPDGDQGLLGGPWNVGTNVCGAGALVNSDSDDFGFVLAMLGELSHEQCLDQERVFASGFSMGGYFTHHLACQGPVPIRAIAPHSGGTYTGDCDHGPVPALLMHGDNDPVISYSCGQEAAEEWVRRDGCTGTAQSWDVEGGSCVTMEQCEGGTSVTFCTFAGMGHGWAGSADLASGGGAAYEDATELSWDLFSAW